MTEQEIQDKIKYCWEQYRATDSNVLKETYLEKIEEFKKLQITPKEVIISAGVRSQTKEI